MDVIINFKPKEEVHMKMAAKIAKLPVGVFPYGIGIKGEIQEGKKCLYVTNAKLYQAEIKEFWEAVELLYRRVFRDWEDQGYELDKNSVWHFYYGITEEEVKKIVERGKKNE